MIPWKTKRKCSISSLGSERQQVTWICKVGHTSNIVLLIIIQFLLGIASFTVPLPTNNFTKLSQMSAFGISVCLVIGWTFQATIFFCMSIAGYFFDIVLHIIIISYHTLDVEHYMVPGSIELPVLLTSRCLLNGVGVLVTFPYLTKEMCLGMDANDVRRPSRNMFFSPSRVPSFRTVNPLNSTVCFNQRPILNSSRIASTHSGTLSSPESRRMRSNAFSSPGPNRLVAESTYLQPINRTTNYEQLPSAHWSRVSANLPVPPIPPVLPPRPPKPDSTIYQHI